MKLKRTNETEAQVREAKVNKLMAGVDAWTSYYRCNPHRFVHDYFGLNLHIFQQIILCMMFFFANLMYLASRGIGKSWLLGVFCSAYAILYPDSKICIASKTRGQAKEIVDKIADLRNNCPNLALEIKEIKQTVTDSYVEFKNGSRVFVVTASDNARHNRATVLVNDCQNA